MNKSRLSVKIVIVLLIILIITSCDKPTTYTNPFDPDWDINSYDWYPSNLELQIIDSSSVKLTWSDNCDFEDGYIVERKIGDEEFEEMILTNENIMEFYDSNFSKDSICTYRIQAYAGIHKSSYSEEVSYLYNKDLFGDIELTNQLVFVKGGTFIMGDDTPGNYNQKPTHTVKVDDFYIGKYEVTQALYDEIIKDNSSKVIGTLKPIDYINWHNAVVFCNKLSDKFDLKKVYTIVDEAVTADFNNNGYRLPTEAEWEYAAKGGNSSGGYRYSGSNNGWDVAWAFGNSDSTHRVGEKLPNELGIYDMSGNVWEWCWDWYGDYTSDYLINPKGPNTGTKKVLRGGSWDYRYNCYTVSFRYHNPPSDESNYSIGFRIVRTVTENE